VHIVSWFFPLFYYILLLKVMKAMKTRALFLIFLFSLAICACTNPLIGSLLQSKTILFDSNGGSYVPPQTLFKNEKISKPRDPVREGYYFGGWFSYLDDYYMNDNYDNYKWDFEVIPDGDMTLYAMWDAKPTPTIDNFIINGVKDFVYDGNPKEVTVTPQEGIIVGKITVYYENSRNTANGRTTNKPFNPGTYWVTFDVAASEDWNSARGLFAGTLTINNTPTENDFIIENLKQLIPNPSRNNISEVYVTPMDGKSSGYVTVYYEGTNGTIYNKDTILPSNIGSYKVTFNVAADTYNNWGAANGLYAGTLEINVFKSIIELGAWLSGQIDNNITNPYPVALNVGNLGVSANSDIGSAAGSMLKENETKYVSLDLSGSSFTSISEGAFRSCDNLIGVTIGNDVTGIGKEAFMGCTGLTGITIPDKVTSIGNKAFFECEALISVTFKGTIPSNGWPITSDDNYVFPGNLREKYFPSSTDGTTGGPGTYTRQKDNDTWTRSSN